MEKENELQDQKASLTYTCAKTDAMALPLAKRKAISLFGIPSLFLSPSPKKHSVLCRETILRAMKLIKRTKGRTIIFLEAGKGEGMYGIY